MVSRHFLLIFSMIGGIVVLLAVSVLSVWTEITSFALTVVFYFPFHIFPLQPPFLFHSVNTVANKVLFS